MLQVFFVTAVFAGYGGLVVKPGVCEYSRDCYSRCKIDGECCPDKHTYRDGSTSKCCERCSYATSCPAEDVFTCPGTSCVACTCTEHSGGKYKNCVVESRAKCESKQGQRRYCVTCKADPQGGHNHYVTYIPSHECPGRCQGFTWGECPNISGCVYDWDSDTCKPVAGDVEADPIKVLRSKI